MSERARPIPVPDELSRPFYEATKRHELLLQRCTSCGAHTWAWKGRCDQCLSGELRWVKSSGRGTLYSYAVVHQLYHPGFAESVPYNVAQVDLDDGLRIIASVVGCPSSELAIGMPLEVTFEDVSDELAIPRFRPR